MMLTLQPTISHKSDIPEDHEIVGAPFQVIRTETVLSRLPIHTLAKTGHVEINITRQNADGQCDLLWRVSPNPTYGIPRQLAYKLDTLIINHRLYQLGRPLPKVVKLGSLTEICTELGSHKGECKRAFYQNATTAIAATLHYTGHDGTVYYLDAVFTRYSVVFTGKRLPDGTRADAVYLILHDPYWEVLNNAPVRPLDYDYLKTLAPAAQRLYELLSYRVFAALKYGHSHATLRYAEYCVFSAQQRYTSYDHVKKQMYKVHKPHITSTYLTSVRYERTTDADGLPDWCMYYVPGPKAHAEYAAFNPRARRRAERPTAVLQAAAPEAVTRLDVEPAMAPPPAVVAAPTADAHALVQYFHQRFHGTPDATPSAKALAQAQDLIARYGVDQARHVVAFSVTAAQETKYTPQTFGGILHYTAQALADYERAQQRRTADERAQDEQRRAQTEEARRAQYEAYRAERLVQLRAALPPAELAAVEQDAAAAFTRTAPSAFGRERLRQLALDEAVAAHGQVPSFPEWQAAYDPC